MENKVISPCISICKTDRVTGYCYGCARTNDEKTAKVAFCYDFEGNMLELVQTQNLK